MKKNIIILLVLAAAVGAYFYFGLNEILTFDFLKSKQSELVSFYEANKVQTIAGFFVLYVVVAALSLPGAAILTVASGAIFGLVTGSLIVSFASSIGATLAFLASRLFFQDFVESKFKDKVDAINKGVEKEGAFYLFTLRLIPAVPFFVVNLVMGLTSLKTLTFYWVSQIGMLAGTIIYVNAGTQLASLDSLSGILSPKIIISFVVLGIFPILAKKIMVAIKGKKSVENVQET